jgi:hypothetical protein
MKTKTPIACLATAFLALSQPARAASFEHRHHVRQTHRPEAVYDQNISGVIPRLIRSGNPLQMLNPLAPAKYGMAEENVLIDSDGSGKVNGINFLSISF